MYINKYISFIIFAPSSYKGFKVSSKVLLIHIELLILTCSLIHSQIIHKVLLLALIILLGLWGHLQLLAIWKVSYLGWAFKVLLMHLSHKTVEVLHVHTAILSLCRCLLSELIMWWVVVLFRTWSSWQSMLALLLLRWLLLWRLNIVSLVYFFVAL